jgi:hypothetical protein
MQITNRHNLPDLFCTAVASFDSDYDKGKSDYSATGLIRPARISALSHRHWEDLEEDVSDRVWSLAGHAGHKVWERLAQQEPKRYVAEKRYFIEVDDHVISAQVDLYDIQNQEIWDYKHTSVWKFVLGDTLEWEQQLNIARYCTEANDHEVEGLKVLCILKDWKQREAERKEDYPQCAVHVVDLPIWDADKTVAFIRERVAAHENARKNLPLCTPDEKWERGEKWAVMKRGNKRAVKLHDTAADARRHADTDGKFYVEHRPAEPTRCLYYCPVSAFCSQFKDWQESQSIAGQLQASLELVG